MKKRALTLFLALVMCLSLVVPTMANTSQNVDVNWVKALSQGESMSAVTTSVVKKYLLNSTQQSNERGTNKKVTAEDIESLCTPVKTQMIGGIICTELKMENYKDFLPESNILRGIVLIGNNLHIDYTAKDGQELSFSYDTNGLNDYCIYDPATDCALYVSRYEQKVYTNFRHGEQVNLSNTENETEVFADLQETRATNRSNFANETALLNDLKANFPLLSNTNTLSRYSSSVGASRNVTVYTGRSNYVKTTASWRSFAASTAISVITLFLGGPVTAQITIAILTGIGVGISAASTIMDQVDLYASANYTFTGVKRMSVYDTTVYNDYVIVDTLSGTGTFAGGYNSNGQFQWIINNPCTVLENDDSSLATSAMDSYDWNVALNGYCTYTPAGFYSLLN